MRRMWLAVAIAAVALAMAGCSTLLGRPQVLAPITPTSAVVVGNIIPLTTAKPFPKEEDWNIPAPQYQELATKFRDAIIAELEKEGFAVSVVKSEPDTAGVEDKDGGNPPPLVLKEFRFYYRPASFLWGGLLRLSVQVFQNGRKVSDLPPRIYSGENIFVRVDAGQNKEWVAYLFVTRFKGLLPPPATAAAASH